MGCMLGMAYYRSKLHNDQLAAAMAEHRKAKEAGDQKRTAAIEAERSREQAMAHRQVFGTGPYDSLAEQLVTVLPKVAEAQKLAVIVPRAYCVAPGVEVVDVTSAILDELQVDQKTRDMIQDMKKKIEARQ